MTTVKASYTVKPAEPTPKGLVHLSDCDQFKATTHAPTIYFYRPTTDVLLQDAIQILKESLSKALVLFYPLAGRLYPVNGSRLELHCNSLGAQIFEAESECKLEDLGEEKDFPPSPKFQPFLPAVDYKTPIEEQPVLLVQLTKLSCGGMCLGVKLSHVIVDGLSALHFVGEWTRIARGEMPPIPPFLDRTILNPKDPLAKPTFEHPELKSPPLLLGKSDNLEERKKPTVVAMLKLSKKQIEWLRSNANQDGFYGRPFTRYETVAGHIWRCASKARGLAEEQLTRMNVSVDFRNRIEPALPPYYFGNTVIRAVPMTTAGELLSKPLGYASLMIRQQVRKFDDEYVRSFLLSIRKVDDVLQFRNFHTAGCAKGPFFGNPNLEITSWVALPIYCADFGWGNEIHMGPPSLGFDGKTFILPGREGDGSFMVAICLQEAHMDAFRKYFYQDI